MLSVVFGYGLPLEFSPAIEKEAASVVEERARAPGPGRKEKTALHVFTIDPADARDHDDALSVESLEDGRVEIGIHIADVAHFVEEGGALDAEAIKRGTSVYLVDRVIPMLPHALSTGPCSLTAGDDRYAVSLFVVLDASAELISHRFERTIVRSRHRLSYEQAEAVIQATGSVDSTTDLAITTLHRFAVALGDRRKERGSLDFDLPSARVVLGPDGEPVDIQRVNRMDSHRLVEEFMLLANEVVAREAVGDSLPLLFRVHEPPKSDRIEELGAFLASLGSMLPKRGLKAGDLKRILARTHGRPEEALVSKVILRSMSRARYDATNLGHFGLASDAYAHFTSPIRRYPDLIAHRALVRRSVPDAAEDAGERDGPSRLLEELAEHLSERERLADQAERDSVELKKVEFMERHLGDEFDGTLSGVASFGFFVLLDHYFVDGLVHVSTLEDDYYVFQEERYSLVGERSGRRFRLGDRARVQVSRVDKEERRIDFVLIAGG